MIMTPTEQDKELQFCESCSCMTRGNPTCGKCGAWRETETMTPIELRKQLVKSLSTAQVESVDSKGEAVIEHEADRLLQLITADRKRVALEARIVERNKIALDTYRGKTVSKSTNWQAMFGYFVDSNERRIAELKAQQEEV